jgi:D-hexose-6-phosphate mutarotase
MENTILPARLRKFEIPGHVAFACGNGGLPKINITTGCSVAEIYLHGAHISAFQKNGEPPLLFMGRLSQFAAGKAIRGGVPVCFPWFGQREGDVMHGFARITEWNLIETAATPDGGVTVRFRLPATAAQADWPAFRAELVVTVTDQLAMELVAANESADRNFDFENCLHTYFAVGNIAQVSLTGLQGAPFLDFAAGASGARCPGEDTTLRITKETNRTYLDTTSAVEIRDENLRRTIRVDKFTSNSTVVWNPWTTQKMPDDFDPAEHQHMVCVESGNVKQNKISLPPGKTAALKVVLGSRSL